jgi:hypothetical protein
VVPGVPAEWPAAALLALSIPLAAASLPTPLVCVKLSRITEPSMLEFKLIACMELLGFALMPELSVAFGETLGTFNVSKPLHVNQRLVIHRVRAGYRSETLEVG